jgi:hypothetical protein
VSIPQPELPKVAPLAEAIGKGVDAFAKGAPRPPQLVYSAPAAGRGALLRALGKQGREHGLEVLDLAVPPKDHDAPAHLLLQLAAREPGSSSAQTLLQLDAPWNERILAARRLLEPKKRRLLLVRVPPSWAGASDWGGSQQQLEKECDSVLALLLEPRKNVLPIVAADQSWSWPQPSSQPVSYRLAASSNGRQFLSDESWGPLAESARRLLERVADFADACSPLQLRLGVALVHEGALPYEIAKVLRPPATLRHLERPLRNLLARRPALAAALRRIACARLPLEPEVMRDLASAGEHQELVERCFLYEEAETGKLLFHDQLRWLLEEAGDGEPVDAHGKLAKHYGSRLDGQPEPKAALRNVLPWLEHLHHASRADALGDVEAWLKLAAPSREHYWEYGWSLSFLHRRYREASEVYKALLDRVGEDNYAEHYYAFNLDKAGIEPVTAEQHYRKAVDGDRANTWWSGRLITFLLERGKFDAALDAWNAALEEIDPDGNRSGGPWLPYNLHAHVIRAALAAGHLSLAQAALDAIGAPARSSPELELLADRVEAARQVRLAGEALFPADEPVARWWTTPRLLARHWPAQEPERWHPGRVLNVGEKEVRLALGKREDEEVVVYYQSLSLPEWKEIAIPEGIEPKAGAFVELGYYGAKRRLAVELAGGDAPEERALEELRYSLRFLSTRGGLG